MRWLWAKVLAPEFTLENPYGVHQQLMHRALLSMYRTAECMFQDCYDAMGTTVHGSLQRL